MRSLDATPNNLPTPLTRFIGRRAEVATVAQLIAQNRLVSLTGAGGCGKTRLSLEVAAEVAERYPDGVWWVDLARLSEEALVESAVAAALDVKEVLEQPLLDTLKNRLRDKHLLLMLDNCEHVVTTCAQLAYTLLQACPSLSILATSREPIGVESEIPWRVPSLGLPELACSPTLDSMSRFEAVGLFVERAGRVCPGFRLTETNAPIVADICRRLDGLPLAIELAAARMRMMTLEQLAAGLDDRFRLLVGSTRTAVPRHQTLRASVEWSYTLLSEAERLVLSRLAVFAGGFTLQSAEEVCRDAAVERHEILDIVTRLVDRSLVQAGEDASGARYRLLETIRQYAGERLASSSEQDAVRGRHLHYFAALADRADAEMQTTGLFRWLPVLDAEHDNLRAAFDWGVGSASSNACLRLSSSLWLFWMVRGHLSEGRQRLEVALAAPDGDPVLRVNALIGAGQLMLYHGDFAATEAFAKQALEIERTVVDGRLRGRALDLLGYSAAFLDPPSASGLFDEATTLLQDAEDHLYLGDAFNGLGIARYFVGDYVGARAALEEGVAWARKAGNANILAIGLGVLGYTLGLQGRLARARTCLREALAISRRLQDRVFTAQALYGLGFIDAHRGAHEEAHAVLDESVGLGREVSPMILAFALVTRGLASYIRGDTTDAVVSVEEALLMSEYMPVPWLRAWALALLGNCAQMRGDLDTASARVGEALAVARSGGLHGDVPIDAAARLARAVGEPERAESLHHDALAAAAKGESVLLVPMQLEALAGLAAAAESYVEAARLFGAAEAARDAHGLVRYEVHRDEYELDVKCVRNAISDEECRTAWEQGRALLLEEAVAYASRGRGERKRPSSGWASLTPTEVEVVRHVVEGLRNAQIAERLFVSPSTVKVHLSHIFAKLGVATRTELASQANRRGLQPPPK